MSKFTKNYKIVVDHERRKVSLKLIGENYLKYNNLKYFRHTIDGMLDHYKTQKYLMTDRYIIFVEEFMKQFPEYLL